MVPYMTNYCIGITRGRIYLYEFMSTNDIRLDLTFMVMTEMNLGYMAASSSILYLFID